MLKFHRDFTCVLGTMDITYFIPSWRSTTLWRAIHDKVSASEKLQNKSFHGSSICVLCWNSEETLYPIFCSYVFFDNIMKKMQSFFHVHLHMENGFHAWLLQTMDFTFSHRFQRFGGYVSSLLSGSSRI